MPRSFRERYLRPLLIDAVWFAGLCAALLVPSAGRAAMISQTISFESIDPFGSFTDGSFTTGGWSSAFPVNNIAGVERFYVTFNSTDAAYLAQQGPLGGVPWIEFGYRDDSSARHAFASMGLFNHTVSFGAENPGHFALLKTLLADGELVVAPGGYENFADHTDNFSFGPTSTLTLSFELPGGGGSTVPGNHVPEPATAALVLAALGVAAASRRRYVGHSTDGAAASA
ncbi:PEP-CTERM sorting domain-containing protein [Aquincola sp. S2]|uniref:PEP-CTERM sorting domain-containing protein n=1 Tax=Pseudaquabacterium terrae TaxID=2732868 RepID=A0ABX2EJY4_9BURK|nr:PEP-CTERM sorting domain-containing protein [Aquabacterium terrae]NRF68890.1 PEP-CTERM sorting domain-containing protein [Aquabacterium terrae]